MNVVSLSTLLLFAPVFAQETQQTVPSKSSILLVVPEADTVITTTSTYRLSASTNPGNSVTVNGKAFKVYPSGAFCGKLNVAVGENLYTITSTDAAGTVVTKTFVINRPKPLETSRADTLMLEDDMMLPVQDMWLSEGDILQVQVKGTPGCTASFLNGIPMKERPKSQTRGIGGMYRGTYKVRATDTLLSQRITFRLQDSVGNAVTRSTYARVSFKPHQLPLVGVTKGERPYLNAGLGDDRLGGYKFSIVNPDIRLRITGKVANMFRVALSDNQEAWIEEQYVELQPPGTFLPSSLTGNMTVGSEGRHDVVTLFLAERLPYASHQSVNPNRIVVNVYGATSNTNAVTMPLTTNEITSVYHQQAEKGVFRITVDLKSKQVWGYEIGYEGTTLKIKVRRPPEHMKLKSLTIAVDAGHGGENKGALGSTGALEKDVTHGVARHVGRLLEEKGARVIMTRAHDTNPAITDRFFQAYRGGADMLISIHANSVGLTSDPAEKKGAATFYNHACYKDLSAFVLGEMVKTGLDTAGLVGGFNFALLGPTEFPSTLVETAFISNPEDEMKLLNDEFRRELAGRIVDGIEKFLDSCSE